MSKSGKILLALVVVLFLFMVVALDAAQAASPFIGTWTVHWFTQDQQQPNVYWPMLNLESTWTFTENTLTYADCDAFGAWAKNKTVSYTYLLNVSNKPIDQHLRIKGVNIDFIYTRLNSTSEFDYVNKKWVVKTVAVDTIRIFMPKKEGLFPAPDIGFMLELTRVK